MPVSLDEDGDGFVLRVRTEGGKVKTVAMSADDVLALMQSAPIYRQQIMARRHPSAVYGMPVSAINLTWDALGETLLLELRLPSNASLLVEVSPENSRKLALQILKTIADRPTGARQ